MRGHSAIIDVNNPSSHLSRASDPLYHLCTEAVGYDARAAPKTKIPTARSVFDSPGALCYHSVETFAKKVCAFSLFHNTGLAW